MRASIGEYNVLYQYILFAITRLSVPALYAVKAVSFLGDAFLAGAAASLAGEEEQHGALALCAVLLLPKGPAAALRPPRYALWAYDQCSPPFSLLPLRLILPD